MANRRDKQDSNLCQDFLIPINCIQQPGAGHSRGESDNTAREWLNFANRQEESILARHWLDPLCSSRGY